jgi:hypothetical protein
MSSSSSVAACCSSEPLILRIEEAGSGLSASRRLCAATTRIWVISSAFSSVSIAATCLRKPGSSHSVPSPAGVSLASRLARAMRCFDRPIRAIPVRSLASRNFA